MKKMKSEKVGVDYQYQEIVRKVINEGHYYDDPNREGVQRLEIPSYTFRHDFKHGFPAITLKKLAFKSVTTELIWFLRGDTNIKYLVDNGCNIWNKDAYKYYLKIMEKVGKSNTLDMDDFIEMVKKGWYLNSDKVNYRYGDLGKVYGHYWRDFNGVDQIKELIHDMINKPMSSELLVVARNPADKEEQALPCCHYGFQIVMVPLPVDAMSYREIDCGELGVIKSIDLDEQPEYGFELHWKQRSCDLFLGIPFNIASYAELALILEKITGHKALAIQGDLKKVHLYDNSIEEAKALLNRECSDERVLLQGYPLTELMDEFDSKPFDIDEFVKGLVDIREDIKLIGYNPQPPMRVEMLSRT